MFASGAKSACRTARILALQALGVDGVALGAALLEVQRHLALAAQFRERVDVALERDEVRIVRDALLVLARHAASTTGSFRRLAA